MNEEQNKQPQHSKDEEDVEVDAADPHDETKKVGETTDQNDDNEDDKEKVSLCRRILDFCYAYQFPLLILLAIILAKAYPPLGAIYLQPQITATWIAVILIFLISGVGLKTAELANAFKRLYFNVFVQAFNFGLVDGES